MDIALSAVEIRDQLRIDILADRQLYDLVVNNAKIAFADGKYAYKVGLVPDVPLNANCSPCTMFGAKMTCLRSSENTGQQVRVACMSRTWRRDGS